MIKTIPGMKKWLTDEEARLNKRLDDSRAIMERVSIQGSLMTVKKLKEMLGRDKDG